MPQWLQAVTGRFAITKTFFRFLWQQRLWWLIPLMIVLFVFGALPLIGQQTVLAPFIYTLF